MRSRPSKPFSYMNPHFLLYRRNFFCFGHLQSKLFCFRQFWVCEIVLIVLPPHSDPFRNTFRSFSSVFHPNQINKKLTIITSQPPLFLLGFFLDHNIFNKNIEPKIWSILKWKTVLMTTVPKVSGQDWFSFLEIQGLSSLFNNYKDSLQKVKPKRDYGNKNVSSRIGIGIGYFPSHSIPIECDNRSIYLIDKL